MLQKELKKKEALFYNPLLLVTLFGSIFLLFNQLGPVFLETDPLNEDAANKKSLLIKTDEFFYPPNTVKIEAGKEVTLWIENTDNIEQDLEIVDCKADNTVDVSDPHNHNQTNNTIHLHAGPGENQSVTFTPTEPGLYQFICTLPGHKESGMVGTVGIA